MKYIRFLLLVLLTCTISVLYAQTENIKVDATNHGTTKTLSFGTSYFITDDGLVGSNERYSLGNDYYVTITSTMCEDPYRLTLTLNELDIDPHDTLYIYDGPSITSPLLYKINNSFNEEMLNRAIYVSPGNVSQTLTIRFRTSTASDGSHLGFTMGVRCLIPCEIVTAVIDSFYYRTVNGQIVEQSNYGRADYLYDTIYHPITGEIERIDTHSYRALNICDGQGVVLVGHGEYTYNTGYYTPSDSTSTFTWRFGNGDVDSTAGPRVPYAGYTDVDCYFVELYIEDSMGCHSNNYEMVLARIAPNPIKTLFTLPEFCESDSLFYNVDYEGGNARLILQQITRQHMESKVNDIRTFIPDGPNCRDASGNTCYTASVEFTEFPQGRTIQSAEDICSICINMEHTFMGDISIRVVCPNGHKAPLFFGNYDPERQALPADERVSNGPGDYGSGQDMGFPYPGSSGCDTASNPYGVGLDYCFSRNSDYMLVTGDPAGSIVGRPAPHNAYITSQVSAFNYTPNPAVTYTIPAGFSGAGTTVSYSSATKMPSDHENKTDYYLPYTDFSELIGCPLNGTWSIEVCDDWGIDNGWVFNWSMDLCNITTGQGCEYQVDVDSIRVEADPTHSRTYPDGRYQGIKMHYINDFSGFILSEDTAGVFPVLLHVYDEFGCRWDTNTTVTVIRDPQPNLGNDTTLCNVQTMVLDARDRFAASQNYTYIWEPTGDTTPTITTAMNTGSDITYSVEVQNHTVSGLVCHARDTIVVRNSPTPVPNLDPGVYPLEGCEPYTIHITNNSLYGATYLWDFGDSTTSTDKDVTHTYNAGNYDVKYYVYSDGGCVDSLLLPDFVHVFHSPHAAFNWDPVYPTVLNPTIQLHNRTEPMVDENNYFWEIQYDRDNPYSFYTDRNVNPTFTWSSLDSDVSGTYIIRLIARTDNFSMTGAPYQCSDTTETTLLLVNDYLQFPNVVTPNGDGVNDRFVIGNLVTGFSYPINSLDIYNRWGARVYHVENISSEEDFWDPSNVPAGTYYYRFVARGYTGNVDHNGVIEVVK